MSELVKIKGVNLELGGKTYVVPPISLGALEQLQTRIASFSGDVSDISQVATVIDAAFAALKRNYPDIQREDVAEMIDVSNLSDVFEAVMDVSGMKRKAQEESAGTGLGEAPRAV